MFGLKLKTCSLFIEKMHELAVHVYIVCITTNKSLKNISIFINTDNFIHNIFQIDNIVTFKLEPKEQYKSNQSSKSHLNF